MDPHNFPESSYESVRPYQTAEEQETKILTREKRQESTAEVLKKANEIILKSKNNKLQNANKGVDGLNNDQNISARDKSVDDIISQAKAQLKANAQQQTLRQQLQQQSHQVPAESSIQARGDTIHRLKSSKSQQPNDSAIDDYASIFNVKIQQPILPNNSNKEYNSIFENANQPAAHSTPNLNNVSQNTISQQEETLSYSDQHKIHRNSQYDQTESSFIDKYSPQKLSATPSKQQQQSTPSKNEITQLAPSSSSSKIQSNITPVKANQSDKKIKTQGQQETEAHALASAYAQQQISNEKMIKSQQKQQIANESSNSKEDLTKKASNANSAKKDTNLISYDGTHLIGKQNNQNVKIYTETEISQMRAILLRRKRERIRRNAVKIICFHVQRYITAKQSKRKHDLMVEFIHHCAQMIQRAVRLFISLRKEKRRNQLINAVSVGWRIRRIIRLPQLIKISNDIKLMEQEKALFPDDVGKNKKKQYKQWYFENEDYDCFDFDKNRRKPRNRRTSKKRKSQLLQNSQGTKKYSSNKGQLQAGNQQQHNDQKNAGKYQQNREEQHTRGINENYEDEFVNSREVQNDKGRRQQQQQTKSTHQQDFYQQRSSPNQSNELEYGEDNVGYQNFSTNSQKSNGQERINSFNRDSNFNSNMNSRRNNQNIYNHSNTNNTSQNLNHAWDDVPVGGNKSKKLNDTLKGWEDAYPAEQELDSNQRELVETKGKVIKVQKNQATKRKQQQEKEKAANDFWDEQPIGGHTKKRMEQKWEEFPDEHQSSNQIKTAVNHRKEVEEIDEKEQEILREERIKRKEQRDESVNANASGAAVAGAKKIDKDKIDNLKKRTKYDPHKAINEAKNKKQQNQETNEVVNKKQQKRTPESMLGNNENHEEEQALNEEGDNSHRGDASRKQVKTTKISLKQHKQETKEVQQTQEQREGGLEQQEGIDSQQQQQEQTKEAKQQAKKEFLKKKPKIIEFQKLNWKNVKSKTNTGRQELEQKTQLFQKQSPNLNQQQFQSAQQQQLNSFSNQQQQQLHYIDELNNNNQGNNQMNNHSEQVRQVQQQQNQDNQQYYLQPNQNNQATRGSPQQNVNTNNPDNYASNHNQFVAQEHFQQHPQPNHPNNNVRTRQQQYLDQVHQKQIAQQQYPVQPKVFTEYLPNKTQVKAITQLAPNQPAQQEIIIRPVMFKDRNTQQIQQQQQQQQRQQSQGLQHAQNGYDDFPEMDIAVPVNYKSNGGATVSDLDRMRQNKKESMLNQQQQQHSQQYQQQNQYVQDYQQIINSNNNNYNNYQQDNYSSQQQRQPQQQMPFIHPNQFRSADGKGEMQSSNQAQRNGEYAVSHSSVPSNSTKQIQAILLKKQEQFMNYGFQ